MNSKTPKMSALVAEGNRKVAAEILYFIRHVGGPPNQIGHTSECPHCRYWGRGTIVCVTEEPHDAMVKCSHCPRSYQIPLKLNEALYGSTLVIDKALRILQKLVNSDLKDSFQAPYKRDEMQQRVGELVASPPSQPALMAFMAAYLSPIGLKQFMAMTALLESRKLVTA